MAQLTDKIFGSKQKLRFLANMVRGQYAILIFLVAFVAALVIISPELLLIENIYHLIRRFTVLGILSAGMTFVVISGGIDLSVGSILAFSGLIVSIMMNRFRIPVAASISIALLVSLSIGLMNGYLL